MRSARTIQLPACPLLATLLLAACGDAPGDGQTMAEPFGTDAMPSSRASSLPPDMDMPIDPGNMGGAGLGASPDDDASGAGEHAGTMAPTAPEETQTDETADDSAPDVSFTDDAADDTTEEDPSDIDLPPQSADDAPAQDPDMEMMGDEIDNPAPDIDDPTLPDGEDPDEGDPNDEPAVDPEDPDQDPDVAVDDIFEGHCVVQPLTAEFRQAYDDLDPFYRKYADADGLPIISSLEPADEALERACQAVLDMVSARPDVHAALIDNYTRFAIIGEDELTNDIPEYAHMPDSINQRARGLGGTPAASCAEESILCNTQRDLWRGEGICIHEFAHTIATAGLFVADPTFEGRLRQAYDDARDAGLFANTYAMENFQEYWAEGVQNWYYTNLESDPPNGVHNWVDRREELQEYDPTLYALIAEFLPDTPQFVDCYSDE